MEQQTLAERTRISPRTIRDIENGNPEGRTRRTATIDKLLNALGLPADTLELLATTPDDGHHALLETLLGDAVAPGERATGAPVVYPVETFIDAFGLPAEAATRLRTAVERNNGLKIS